MDADEMFDSAVRMKGDLAGVFEHDGEACYFYLYQTEGDKDRKVLCAIRILVGDPDLQQADINVRWNNAESIVGLFIEGQLWAAFDGDSGANTAETIARTHHLRYLQRSVRHFRHGQRPCSRR